MKAFMHFLNRPITDETHDGLFARWACYGSAAAVFMLAAVFFSRHSQDLTELAGGLGLALMTSATLVLTGASTSRLHFALLQNKPPMRSRLGEFAGYVGTLSLLFAGVGYLATLALNRTAMTMGLLLVLSASMAPTCVGAWSTLRAVRIRQVG